MTSTPLKRRGRPRAYDPDVALGRARDTFWRKGFGATSVDDLAAGMGMNRPSIYAAFGDKRALYLQAVTEYSRASVAALGRGLNEPRSLRDGLRAVYQGACVFYQVGDQDPRGCFLIGTAVTEANGDPQVRTIVDETFEAFTAAFTERFERAARDGQLAPLPPAALAHIATATLNNIALRARTGASAAAIDALIDATIDAICGPAA
jgi:TetR/AcrR family transcriptional regulator, copper-responsive repressor